MGSTETAAPKNNLKAAASFAVKHLPIIAGAALVAINYLVDNNAITLSAHSASLLNAVLAALGIGSLHYNQQKS